VHLLGRQPTQLTGYIIAGDLDRLIQGLPLCHLRDHAGDGYGRAAAKGPELDVIDPVVLDFDEYLHEIATDGISHFAVAVRILDHPHVPGVHEVIHNCLIVAYLCHPSITFRHHKILFYWNDWIIIQPR
jgi:hypothetical protein